MRPLPARSLESLTPLSDEIRARAEASAQASHDDASRRSAALLADANREAESIARHAVDAGTAAARSDAAQRSARERRRAHELRLAGREAVRRDLEERVVARATALRTDPEYPRLLDALRSHARAVLGPEAATREHPDGGIVATSGTRRLDLSLPSLARATLESMTEEVSELWMS